MFKNFQVFASILICIFAVTMFSPLTVSAGASKITIDNTSFQESIDGTTWNNPSGDVQVKNQTLLFEENSTRYTRLITKTSFNVYEYSDEIVSADYEAEFEKIPEGQSFILAFGLSSIEGVSGEEGNLEIAITNHSGLKISILEYQKSNEPVTLMNEKSIGTKSKISVTICKDKQLILTVNGEKLYHGAIGVKGVGRAGFLQTGKCKVTITNVKIASERYDHPENCDVYETFDNGKMNTNALTSCMFSTVNYAPSVCEIQEYNGDYVLMFKNCGTSYISTKYQYSNFEMTFDVPYLGRKAVYSETDPDVVVEPKNSYLGISVGDSYLETNYEAFQTSYEMFVMADSNIYAWKDGYKLAGKADENHLVYDRNESRGFSLKITCMDGEFQFAVKWMDEQAALIGTFYYCRLMFTKSQKNVLSTFNGFTDVFQETYPHPICLVFSFLFFCGYFFEFHIPIDHFLWYNTLSCQICFAYLLVIYLLLLVADQSWLTSQKIYFFLSFLFRFFSIPCKHITAGKYLLSV